MPREKQSNAAIEQGHGIADDTWTWQLRPTENAKPITMVMRCCLCRLPLYRKDNGWCLNCNTWPINVTPLRYDKYAHKVEPDGFCWTCRDFMLTALDPHPGEWIDTGIVPKLCTKEENMRQARKLMGILSGPGWPEKQVELRRDFIPRSWKRTPLRVTGQTPLGYDIVLPAGIADDSDTDAVQF